MYSISTSRKESNSSKWLTRHIQSIWDLILLWLGFYGSSAKQDLKSSVYVCLVDLEVRLTCRNWVCYIGVKDRTKQKQVAKKHAKGRICLTSASKKRREGRRGPDQQSMEIRYPFSAVKNPCKEKQSLRAKNLTNKQLLVHQKWT